VCVHNLHFVPEDGGFSLFLNMGISLSYAVLLPRTLIIYTQNKTS
jgi:hypothetical protein